MGPNARGGGEGARERIRRLCGEERIGQELVVHQHHLGQGSACIPQEILHTIKANLAAG